MTGVGRHVTRMLRLAARKLATAPVMRSYVEMMCQNDVDDDVAAAAGSTVDLATLNGCRLYENAFSVFLYP